MFLRRNFAGSFVLSAIAFAALAPAAFAQATKSETRFQDWVVGCDESGGSKKCTISQTFTKAGTNEVGLAFVLTKKDDGSLKAAVYSPTQVLLAPGVTVNAGDLPPINAAFLYCAPRACLAEFGFDDQLLDVFRKGTDYAVTFQPVNQQPVTVKGSLKGFAAAYEFFSK
jgi:invasion protein IalB